MKTKRMFYLPQASAEVNAGFDASKMGDMCHFDPNK